MVFIETPTFTRLIAALLEDDEYAKLQEELARCPDAGDLIKDGGGIRKIRWKRAGTGKSGGVRVIYYWLTEDDQFLMLVAYPKSVKDSLTDKETAILRKLVKELQAMDKMLFEDLKQSLKEAASIRRGKLAAGRVSRISAPDAKTIRAKVGLTQSEFAQLIGVKVATLRNWEQHRRSPTGAAAALLTIVEKEPDAALRALHS